MSTQVDTSIQGKEHATAERLKANTGVEPERRSQKQSAEQQQLEHLCINTVRTLAMDAVQKANSGHPGTPMALAPLAFVLWDRYLRFNPRNPQWPGRDRFILSNGHASMLLYAMLYLTGFDLTLDDIKQFRQWGSKTPGHPEYGLTAGVETTTGPLGQGCGNSVGFAIAQRWLAAQFNKPGHDLFDYRTYVFCGDGDLMEGVSNEAASVAGHLGLSNLIWFYDNNHITIEGSTSLAFSDDVATRFRGWHWNVLNISDVNDLELVDVAIRAAQREAARPTLVIVDTHIGWGSPNRQDTKEAHGEALGVEEVRLTKEAYGWPSDAQFLVPDEVRNYMRKAVERGAEREREWDERYTAWSGEFSDLAKQWQLMADRALPEGWGKDIPSFPADAKGVATRESNSKVLNAVAKNVPWLIGGAADLYPSTKTLIKDGGDFERNNYGARNFHFGIREHTMGSIANGMSLSLVRPYTATFLIFSDYMKPPIRLAALMDVPVIFIYTHDSIGLGEDGPTHQPIEQLASLRAMPHLSLWRPCDAAETAVAWTLALERRGPTALVLTRQAVAQQPRSAAQLQGIARGGYVLIDCPGNPEALVIATGSEIGIAAQAVNALNAAGRRVRLVSLPSTDVFDAQDDAYREAVLPRAVTRRLAVEAGATQSWWRYVGQAGKVLGIDRFGASGKAADVFTHFGFTADNIALQVRALLEV